MYILNLNLLAQLGGELCEKQYQKMIETTKTPPNNHFFSAVRGFNGAEKSRPLKSTFFLSQFREKIEKEQHFLGVRKWGRGPHISPLNSLRGLVL